MSEEKETTSTKRGRNTSQEDAPADAKLKALQQALANIEKAHGKGSIMNLGAKPVEQISVIPTGSLGIDDCLGIGGYPRGRIVEIFGPESSGKTTLAIHAIAEVQKQGGNAALIDAEHAFDPTYAAYLGVDINKLWISQPDNGEQALDIAEQLIRSGAMDLVIVDSVAALTPKKEIEGDMGDSLVGLHARLMSQALRKITGAVSKSNTTCIFINQLREKIGGTSYGVMGNEVTTGGNALKFYASIRIDVRRGQAIKQNDDTIGYQTKIRILKNKLAPPFRKAMFDMYFGEGICKLGEIVDLGVELDVITKSGSWFSYGSIKLGQGKDAAKAILADNDELRDELMGIIRTKLKEADPPINRYK